MDKKWYNFFVSVDQPEGAQSEAESSAPPASKAAPRPAARSAAQTVAEIASSVAAAEPKFTMPVSNPTSFEEIYQAAEIRPPTHGYSILKVGDMLQHEAIRDLPPEVKRKSILVALDAAGVKLDEILQDAVRRDKALDTYERVQQKSVEDLEAKKQQENKQIQAEMDKLVADYRKRMEANNDQVAKEKERFYGWRLQKQQEEQKIADAVGYFASPNPISTRGPVPATSSAPKPPGPKGTTQGA